MSFAPSQHVIAAAVRRLRAAEEACPHWEFETGLAGIEGQGHACCREMVDASRALRALRKQKREERQL